MKNGFDKKIKLFKIKDVFVYAFGVMLILFLFVFFVFINGKEDAEGFRVILNGKEIIRYIYDGNKTLLDGTLIEESFEEGYTYFKVYTEDKNGFNLIKVNEKEKTVAVIESNCSSRADCVHTPEIKGSHGVIICVPHSLKIIPIVAEYTPPVIG